MIFDLSKDQEKIRRFILKRIKEYDIYENWGPGSDEGMIQLVTMGYYLEQGGWFSLVFDTRSDADNDGEWTSYIEEDITLLEFPSWCSLMSAWYDGKPIDVILPNKRLTKINQTITLTKVSHRYSEKCFATP